MVKIVISRCKPPGSSLLWIPTKSANSINVGSCYSCYVPVDTAELRFVMTKDLLESIFISSLSALANSGVEKTRICSTGAASGSVTIIDFGSIG